MQRVAAYIDGFNLYFGLRQSKLRRYYWLDLPALITTLLKPDQQLVATHYFTARIKTNGHNAADAKRQSDYIALLDGIAAAVETEETLRWQLVAAQETVAIWRTESANNRAIDRAAA